MCIYQTVELIHLPGTLMLMFALWQEKMSVHEIEAAIHTDSRHADWLWSVYSSRETSECGYVVLERIDFLGSRKSFEVFKCVSGDNNSNIYEIKKIILK